MLEFQWFQGTHPSRRSTTASISYLGTDEVMIDLGTTITNPTTIELILDDADVSSIDSSEDKSVDLRFNSGKDGAINVNASDEFAAEYDSALVVSLVWLSCVMLLFT